MGRRTSASATIRRAAPGGESPNSYIPEVTVDVRVFFPPMTHDSDVRLALHDAYIAVMRQLEDHFKERDESRHSA